MIFLDNIKVADTFSLSGVKIYPNPAKDVLNIESSTEVLTKVSITDLNGRVVKEVSNNLSQISFGNLAKGIYMVTIESATAKKVERLIVE
jgi:predicted AAA+ superfamily ATPase